MLVQELTYKYKEHSPPQSFGGVVVRSDGCLLLVKHQGDPDTKWTWPKGKMEAGESQKSAALREVLEETGYACKAVQKLPGDFRAGKSVGMFLMIPLGGPRRKPSPKEIAKVRWVGLKEAETLLAKSPSLKHCARDLKILEAALQELQKYHWKVKP